MSRSEGAGDTPRGLRVNADADGPAVTLLSSTMDTVFVAGANGAQAAGQSHTGWPGRRVTAAWFGVFTIYAGAIAGFTGHADSNWAVWAFGGYAVATMLFWFGSQWLLPLAVALGGALVAPLLWLVIQVPPTAEVLVIGRGANHLLKFGTPYLPPGELSGWKLYNPYLPVMEVFGLPRSAGLSGVLGDPRLWVSLVTVVLIAVAFTVVSPHRLGGCADCRRRVAVLTALAAASPVIAFPLALGITDPPLIALLCLTLAWASRGKVVRAALVLTVACAMKTTAWAAVPVLAIMAWVQYAPRAAVRFTATAVAGTGILALLAAPDALARPEAVKQNLIDFPLGLTKHKTPAASPLPGHLIAGLGTIGHYTAMALMVLAAVAFTAWILLRPPRNARDAAWRLVVGYTTMFVLDPSTRFGYFVYPLALLGWMALTKTTDRERAASAPPGAPLLVGAAD
jgi:glycosyl transferase family 87